MFFYDIKINDNISNDDDTATSTDAINYEEMEKAFYNALSTYYNEHDTNSSDYSNNNIKSYNLSSNDSDLIEFSTDTDAQLYTCTVENAPDSIAQQVGAYILDIRNILFIFLLVWLIITIYSKLKNSFYNFFWRS